MWSLIVTFKGAAPVGQKKRAYAVLNGHIFVIIQVRYKQVKRGQLDKFIYKHEFALKINILKKITKYVI